VWAPPWSSGSVLDHRLLPPVFESQRGNIWRLFHLWLRFITFGGHSAQLAYHVHKSGRKTSIIIINHHNSKVLASSAKCQFTFIIRKLVYNKLYTTKTCLIRCDVLVPATLNQNKSRWLLRNIFQLSVSPTSVVIIAIVNATTNMKMTMKMTIKFNCIVLTTETCNCNVTLGFG